MTAYELYNSALAGSLGASDFNALRDAAQNQWNNAAANFNASRASASPLDDQPFTSYLGSPGGYGMGAGGKGGAMDPMARMAAMMKLREAQYGVMEEPYKLAKLQSEAAVLPGQRQRVGLENSQLFNQLQMAPLEFAGKQQGLQKTEQEMQEANLRQAAALAKAYGFGAEPGFVVQSYNVDKAHPNQFYVPDRMQGDPMNGASVKIPGGWFGMPESQAAQVAKLMGSDLQYKRLAALEAERQAHLMSQAPAGAVPSSGVSGGFTGPVEPAGIAYRRHLANLPDNLNQPGPVSQWIGGTFLPGAVKTMGFLHDFFTGKHYGDPGPGYDIPPSYLDGGSF